MERSTARRNRRKLVSPFATHGQYAPLVPHWYAAAGASPRSSQAAPASRSGPGPRASKPEHATSALIHDGTLIARRQQQSGLQRRCRAAVSQCYDGLRMASAGRTRIAAALGSLAVCTLALSLLGCSRPVPERPAATAARAGSALDSGLEHGLRIVEARDQGLELPLPDAAGWRRDPRERHSWVARHLRSSSQLVLRAWRFDDIARPEACEQQARLWRRDLPSFAPLDQIDQSERLLGGYRSRVMVGVRESPREPGRLLGHVLAFGSDARSCLLLAFSTTATGAAARSVIARRLAIMEGTVLQRLRRLDIEDRVTVPRL